MFKFKNDLPGAIIHENIAYYRVSIGWKDNGMIDIKYVTKEHYENKTLAYQRETIKENERLKFIASLPAPKANKAN